MIEEILVLEILRGVQDPELGKNLVELGMVHDVGVGKIASCVSHWR